MKKQTKIERYLDIAQVALIYILSWTWGIIQQIVALCYFAYLKITKKIGSYYVSGGYHVYYCETYRGSVSLGNHVFLCKSHWTDEVVLQHELGHCKQSLILGPLYLFVIGIPSILWCDIFYPRKMKKWRAMMDKAVLKDCINRLKPSYYDFYTEKWANKLAGLEIK